MAYIKKLVMHGFKSFARKTEILFDPGINVILGPNGAGKSNISDSLCFVLGRLSIKSIRAAKASNLLFMGSKYIKPAKEASVELIFDNSDRAFNIDANEIHLTRIVRHNGQSIYKINNETKTRAEIIEMLAQAGIDPHGANIVLQGQIQSTVRMHPEDRRKVIEEISGISIYESRKEKSLHELEKTESRLKEISTILRERSSFLRNLENERTQAMKFKELELTVKRCKASILKRRIEEKEKELKSITDSIHEKTLQKDKLKAKVQAFQQLSNEITEKINQINKHIQQSSGIEQEALNSQIANLKAELEGLRVRHENYESRMHETERRIQALESSIPELEKEIQDLRKKSPLTERKSQELKKKKEELAKIEEQRRSVLTLRTQLASLREKEKDTNALLSRTQAQSESLLKQIEENSIALSYKNQEECFSSIHKLKKQISELKHNLSELAKKEIENEKASSISEQEIANAEKIKSKVEKIDICPLCHSKITQDHIEHVFKEADSIIEKFKQELENSSQALSRIKEEKSISFQNLSSLEKTLSSSEIELIKHSSINEKKESLKKLVEHEKQIKSELIAIAEKRSTLEKKSLNISDMDSQAHAKMLEIEEISARTEQNLDTALLYKERELEGIRNAIKNGKHDLEEISLEIKEIEENIDNKSSLLEKKQEEEAQLNAKFKKLFKDRDDLQKKIQETNLFQSSQQSEIYQIEEQINYLKVGKAKLDAEKEAVEMDLRDFLGIEIIKAPMHVIEERLQKAQQALNAIGSINMRALEVYEQVKDEYDKVQEKVNILEKEKEEILKIIEEIDNKKKKTFMRTFKAINHLFSENFSRLSSKGIAYLELENQEDIFAGGVNIIVKLSKGKYFDVTSLSGGEQTLVALSLLFAIQEHRPYHFYIFDEIDAALDKRNSERLAGLLKQYMKAGQYIVITHNDAIILESNVLYGVSMQDGVSKVLSLKVD